MASYKIGRRELLKTTLAGAAGLSLGKAGCHKQSNPAHTGKEHRSMPKRRLGRTGYDVTLFSLGGQSTIEQPGREEEAVAIINHAMDMGVNYVDTAERYGRGVSETYLGKVMKERRKEMFLATKSSDYSYDGTMRLCEESLKRLQTDYLDLYQHHAVGNEEQLDRICAEDGALRAFDKLYDEGVIKHKGITGHSPRILLEGLNRHDYDCVLITLNAANASMDHPEDMDKFLAAAGEKDVGIIAMKVVGRGRVLERGLTMEQAFNYTLSHPVATAVIGITELWQIEENVKLACDFEPLSEVERAELERIAQG